MCIVKLILNSAVIPVCFSKILVTKSLKRPFYIYSKQTIVYNKIILAKSSLLNYIVQIVFAKLYKYYGVIIVILGTEGLTKKEQLYSNILDTLLPEVFVVRNQQCELLFSNAASKDRLSRIEDSGTSCKLAYGNIFPRICNHCVNTASSGGRPFDIADVKNKIFEATTKEIDWLDGEPAIVITLHDVDEIRRKEQHLYTLAYSDHLTRIPNRQRLMREFKLLTQNKDPSRFYAAIAIFDIDYFKNVNDTYGHSTGDVMLRRLTEHLENIEELSGHLYRLGGDEFVLYFLDKQKDFASVSEYREHCSGLLSRALQTYTMPNIDLVCTISMGVSIYPDDGTVSSDLLRKADVALYEAKAAGRNCLVFYESRFDRTNKKFTDYYISINPILGEDGNTFGYELSESSINMSDSSATDLNDVDRAIEAIAPADLLNGYCYFIRYSNSLETKAVLDNLDRSKFVIEIPAPAVLTQSILDRCSSLKAIGYSLALVGIDTKTIPHKLMEIVDYCRFSPKNSVAMLNKQVIDAYPTKKFIAIGVNTHAQYAIAKRVGFHFFQGNYLNEPTMLKKEKDIDPIKANYYRLLRLTSSDGYVDFAQVSEIISSDVALSYKLLKILNSPAVGLRNRMSSIPMAVSYMGEEALKKWIALLAIRGVADDKPLEIVRLSLIRAQFGELLAPLMTPKLDSRHAFLVGMFSLLHIALEKTPKELLSEITVDYAVRDSLLGDGGPYSDMLRFFSSYEYSNWDEVTAFAEAHGLSSESIYQSYLAAVRWYNELATK